MNLENNFPIKYAAMELVKLKWPRLGNPFSESFCYIVSECYLISETKHYFSDGTFKMYYEIVFPWKKDSEEKIVPKINYDGKCYNSVVVEQIFDDLESAKNYTREINQLLIAKNVDIFPSETFLKRKLKMEEEIEKAYQLESIHLDVLKVKKLKRKL